MLIRGGENRRQNLLQRKLSRAQTKYELKKKDVTQQSSYNLS